MALLNPILLFGVLGIAVPIVIHLLNKQRVERVWWGAMRFLKVAVEKNQRRLRVEDWILLVVRCVVVGLIALVLARPALREGAGLLGGLGQSGVTAVLVVDVSGSMQTLDGVRTRGEVAAEAAEQWMSTLPAGSRVALWAAGTGVRKMVPEPTSDLNLLRRAILELPATDVGSNLMPAVREGVEALQRQRATRKELVVITDGQERAFTELEAMRTALAAARPEVTATFIRVGEEETANVGISGLRQATGIAAEGRPVRVTAAVTNYGASEVRSVRVVLRRDEGGASQAPLDEAVVDAIAAGGTRSVSLFARLSPAGMHALRAEIAEASGEGDRMRFDDARSLAVRVVDQVRVLVVEGDAGREAREGQAFYLRQALGPVAEEEAARWFVRTDVVGVGELGSSRLDDYDAVVLCGVADISRAEGDRLAAFVRRGGGLVLFPGPQTRPELINRAMVENGLLPAGLEAARGDLTAEQPLLRLSTRRLEHPVAAIWADPSSGDLGGVSIRRAFGLRGTESGRAVLWYGDDTPAAMEHGVGDGRVMVFGFPATTQWTDLPVRPAVFVPLVYRALGWVIGGQEAAFNVGAGEGLVYRASGSWLGGEATVLPPGVGEEGGVRVGVELLSGEGGVGGAVVRFGETDRAGLYRLVPPVGVGGGVLKFAVTGDPGESELALLGAAGRSALAEWATLVDYATPASLAGVVRQRSGMELFGVLATLLMVLVVSEAVMAWWFSRPR